MNHLAVLVTLCLCCLFGCNPAPSSNLPVTRMTIGDRDYTLEIAAEPVHRQIGLMRRDSMPARHGMIFVFPDEQERHFWMKDTKIPLDILFLDGEGNVISIKQMRPHVGTASSDGPARYAIELNMGQANDCGVKVGDRLTVPEAVRQLKPER